MKSSSILIINNGTLHLKRLIDACLPNKPEVVNASNFTGELEERFDGFILSGSSDISARSGFRKFTEEVNFFKQTQKPVLGICFGFQLICYAFGSQLISYPEKLQGNSTIRTKKKNALVSNSTVFQAHESHKWIVKSVEYPLEIVAVSDVGIEIVKHFEKPLYGVQFHPETSQGVAREVITNFISQVVFLPHPN